MEGESLLNRIIIDEHHSSVFHGYQMQIESGITRSIINELHSWDIKLKVKVVLLEASLMNFVTGISKAIKCKLKVVLLEVSLMNIILPIYKEIN